MINALLMSWYIGLGVILVSSLMFKPRKMKYRLISFLPIVIPFIGTAVLILIFVMQLLLLDDLNLKHFDDALFSDEVGTPRLRNHFVNRFLFRNLPWNEYDEPLGKDN